MSAAESSQQNHRRPPIVVVAGPTGVGKSQLAIELAAHFGGDVVNADSMQLYSGLDIVTNKVTPAEQAAALHHLIGCLSPMESDNTAATYRTLAQPLLDRLLSSGRLPIVCGGTCYYIESLLWDILLPDGGFDSLGVSSSDDDVDGDAAAAAAPGRDGHEQMELMDDIAGSAAAAASQSVPAAELHSRLRRLDPTAADRLHPNNRRKVARALEVNLRRGPGAYSRMLQQQHALGDQFSGPLHYPPSRLAILWLACDKAALDARLDARVDKMLEAGLLAELEAFHAEFNNDSRGGTADYTKGIFQSIGFKEFHDYLVMSPAQRAAPAGLAALAAGVKLMKLHTRQYAVKQEKWLRNRFLRHPPDNYAPVFRLPADSLAPNDWDLTVRRPAFEIVRLLTTAASVAASSSVAEAAAAAAAADALAGHPARLAPTPRTDRQVVNRCDACGATFYLESQYRDHMAGKRHARRLTGLRRRARRAAVAAAKAASAPGSTSASTSGPTSASTSGPTSASTSGPTSATSTLAGATGPASEPTSGSTSASTVMLPFSSAAQSV